MKTLKESLFSNKNLNTKYVNTGFNRLWGLLKYYDKNPDEVKNMILSYKQTNHQNFNSMLILNPEEIDDDMMIKFFWKTFKYEKVFAEELLDYAKKNLNYICLDMHRKYNYDPSTGVFGLYDFNLVDTKKYERRWYPGPIKNAEYISEINDPDKLFNKIEEYVKKECPPIKLPWEK